MTTDGLTRRNTLSTVEITKENNQAQKNDGKGSRLSVGLWARPRSAVLQREMRRNRIQNVNVPSTGTMPSTGGDIWTVAGDPSSNLSEKYDWSSSDSIQRSEEVPRGNVDILHTLDETVNRKRDSE